MKPPLQYIKDYWLGRTYWRNRALELEKQIVNEPIMLTIVRERDRYQEEARNLRLLIGDVHLSVLWFEEAKKAHAEAAKYKKELDAFKKG